ncbi:hypothetical protein GOV09_04995 [Candidatus Woesearchaeota archaeon]|nr:hypothetical protein [Candidatus Woesearchaeota archaeon]
MRVIPEHHNPQGKYIKSIVYGGLDGIITTFAVVAGVAGASLSFNIVLILGFANLFADGLSMAIGDYLSSKAEREYHKAERKREKDEIEKHPEQEKDEMRKMLAKRGFTKKDAASIVSLMSKNKKAWIDLHLIEELGIVESDESPIKNAIATFLSFAVFGFIPLLAYVIYPLVGGFNVFLAASILTGITLFALGSLKVKVTSKNWFTAGLETFFVGGLTAVVAYSIGFFISTLV